MCFICDIILCKSCVRATTRSRERSKDGRNNSNFQKCAWRKGWASSDDARRQETGKVEVKSDGTDSKIPERSTSYMGVKEVTNTVKCVADKQLMPSMAYGTPAVLGEENIFQDNNVQSLSDPTLVGSLTGISEYDGVREVVEETIVKVDKTQLNMCKAMDGSLLGRIMY